MDGYREPSKRPKVPRKLRSWFIQNLDGSEKGPFEYDALISSGKADRIKPSTLCRPEDERAWVPLSDLLEKEAKKASKKAADDWQGPSSPHHQPDLGSFAAGFCAGFFGGCIGFALVLAVAKGDDTKRGARWGFFFQVVIGLLFRILSARSHTYD